jgi:hypothetical protein
MKLLIGNRNYSSWSMRPWLVLKHFDIPFEDEVLQLSGEGSAMCWPSVRRRARCRCCSTGAW